jgi:hypothetical protein
MENPEPQVPGQEKQTPSHEFIVCAHRLLAALAVRAAIRESQSRDRVTSTNDGS